MNGVSLRASRARGITDRNLIPIAGLVQRAGISSRCSRELVCALAMTRVNRADSAESKKARPGRLPR